jgi:tRNA (cytosine34-C5)-methyltransferase
MGKAGKNRRKNHNFAAKRRKKQQEANKVPDVRSYTAIVKENESFETYYKAQNICPVEDWPAFITALKEDLPSAFRITGSRGQAQALLAYIRKNFFDTPNELEQVEAVSMPWYPGQLAWQLKLSRKDIRRSEMHYRLHNLLVSETEIGYLSRQEVVSMIPPLVLGVEPHHKVLDMCAAPGSKTAQIIEMLHAGDEDGKLPEGMVIANDVDNKRCYMLVHQAKRLNSPCVIITNHDASAMPNFTLPSTTGTQEILKFDRILCDVPCSGDGTLRKNPDVWPKWHAGNGNNLHGMQFRIVKRGAELLAIGGRLVYSTCSFNPIENEAVVHRLLDEAKGALTLVDISLPGLKFKPGMDTWTPMSRDLKSFTSFDEVPANLHTQIRPHLFPPSPDKAAEYHLEKCVRILPHMQDTGGFFVAVLEKHSPLPWESSGRSKEEQKVPKEETTESQIAENGEDNSGSPAKKKRKVFGYKEDPFCFFTEDDPLWPHIRDYYKISPDFSASLLLTRCQEGKKKNIYMTSKSVRDIVIHNQDKIKLINTGVKVFVRCDNKEMKCDFRIAQEGLPIIWPVISGRIVTVASEDMINLLANDNPSTPPRMETLTSATREIVDKMEMGSCVLVCEAPVEGGTFKFQLVGWRGKVSCRAYVAKNERIHYLRLLGADVSKLEVNKFKERDKDEQEEASTVVSEKKNGDAADEIEAAKAVTTEATVTNSEMTDEAI